MKLLRNAGLNLLLAACLQAADNPTPPEEDGRSRELVVKNIYKTVNLVRENMKRWAEQGEDPHAAGLIMRDEFTPLMRESKHREAEKVALRALAILRKGPLKPVPKDLSRYRRTSDETHYLVFPIREVDALHGGRTDLLEQRIRLLREKLGSATDPTARNWAFHLMIPAWRYDPEHLDNPNANIRQAVRNAFEVVLRTDVAVHFTVETHEWPNRPDLWNYADRDKPGHDPDNRANVEWTDWNGTPHPHRYRNWGKPERMPPVACYNSPAVLKEVTRLAGEVAGAPIAEGIAMLKKAGKLHLLSGVTVGAEPDLPNYERVDHHSPAIAALMEQDGVAKARLGYNALANKGYSPKNPPDDFARALAEINREYLAFWAERLVEAGLPPRKLYTHVAAGAGVVGSPEVSFTNAPIDIAFIPNARPGWTTYPIGPLRHDFEVLYQALHAHGSPPWAATEAGPRMGRLSVAPEEYLSRHFDYGATLVLFNVGATSDNLADSLAAGVWSEQAITAYRKFLRPKK